MSNIRNYKELYGETCYGCEIQDWTDVQLISRYKRLSFSRAHVTKYFANNINYYDRKQKLIRHELMLRGIPI